MTLNSRIKVRLAELNTKQQYLGEQLGVTKQTINGWVNGRTIPTLETAFKIAKILNCKVDDLFIYEDDE